MAVRRYKIPPPSLAQTIRESTTRTIVLEEPFRGIRAGPSAHALKRGEVSNSSNFLVAEGRLRNWPSYESSTSVPGGGIPLFMVASGHVDGSTHDGFIFAHYSHGTNFSSQASRIHFWRDHPSSLTGSYYSMAISSSATANPSNVAQVAVGGSAELTSASGQAVFYVVDGVGNNDYFPCCWFPLQTSVSAQQAASVLALTNFTSVMSSARAIAHFDDRLIFGHVNQAGAREPNRLIWTARGTNTDFTGISAGQEDLEGMSGPITTLFPYDNRLLIFSTNQTWVATPRRDEFAFEFDILESNIGCAHDQLIANTPYGLFWYDRFNFYRHIGNSTRKVCTDLSKRIVDEYRYTGAAAVDVTSKDVKALLYTAKTHTLQAFVPNSVNLTSFDVYTLHLDTLRGDTDSSENDDCTWTYSNTGTVTNYGNILEIPNKPMAVLSDQLTHNSGWAYAAFVTDPGDVETAIYFPSDTQSRVTMELQTPIIRADRDPNRIENLYEVSLDYKAQRSHLSYHIGMSDDLGVSFTTIASGSALTTATTLDIPVAHAAAKNPIYKFAFVPSSGGSTDFSLDRIRMQLRSWTGRRK